MRRCEGLPAALRLAAAYLVSLAGGRGRGVLVSSRLNSSLPAIPPPPGIKIKKAGLEDLPDILELRGPIIVKGRLERGDVCFLAYAGGRAVSSAWYTAREDYMLELRREVSPPPGAVYQFGVYTLPAYRGKGITTALTAALLADARTAGYSRAEGLIISVNRGAIRMVMRAGYGQERSIYSGWLLGRKLFSVEEGLPA